MSAQGKLRAGWKVILKPVWASWIGGDSASPDVASGLMRHSGDGHRAELGGGKGRAGSPCAALAACHHRALAEAGWPGFWPWGQRRPSPRGLGQSSPLGGVRQDIQKALHLTQVLFSVWDRKGDTRSWAWAGYGCARPAPGPPSFLSILLIMRRRGSMYLDSCFSLSRYCCSSAWLAPAGLRTELGFTAGHAW